MQPGHTIAVVPFLPTGHLPLRVPVSCPKSIECKVKTSALAAFQTGYFHSACLIRICGSCCLEGLYFLSPYSCVMLGVECINKCVLVVNEVIHMLLLISLLLKFDKAYLCKTFSVAVLFFCLIAFTIIRFQFALKY